MRKTPILLIGGGGHCRSCIDVIEMNNHYDIIGIVDNQLHQDEWASPASICGYPVVGADVDLPELRKVCSHALISVGAIKSQKLRQYLYERVKKEGFICPPVISPLAHVSRHAQIDSGTIVMHHALINAGAKIGSNCIINSKALLEHDVSIGDHVHISTGAIVNGGTSIGNMSFIGSGATLIQGIKLPAKSFVTAHARIVSSHDYRVIEED